MLCFSFSGEDKVISFSASLLVSSQPLLCLLCISLCKSLTTDHISDTFDMAYNWYQFIRFEMRKLYWQQLHRDDTVHDYTGYRHAYSRNISPSIGYLGFAIFNFIGIMKRHTHNRHILLWQTFIWNKLTKPKHFLTTLLKPNLQLITKLLINSFWFYGKVSLSNNDCRYFRNCWVNFASV